MLFRGIFYVGVLSDHDNESTLFWLIWARGNVMDVFGICHTGGKREEGRWEEVDYGYISVCGVKRV